MPDPRLSNLTAAAGLPYDRAEVRAGVLHLGVGGFHRAHQAATFDTCLAEDPRWGIRGVNLRSPAMAEALGPQDGLYTLLTRGPGGTKARIIGALLSVETGAEAALAAIADPSIHLITLTVTEKAYCLAPGGGLDPSHPDVVADLNRPVPRSVPALLATGLAARMKAGVPPPTVLSCDNLSGNGGALRRAVLDFAAVKGNGAAMLEDAVAFPASMVDQIVPATEEQDRREAAALTGLHDAWPVVTEPFHQWVIEDRFNCPRPDLARAGVDFTTDIAPFERMKLRMLNGSHSALAYLGLALGRESVAEAVADPLLTRFLPRLMRDELAPTVDRPEAEKAAYASALMTRFRNPGLAHRLSQIAADGSQKLGPRLVAPMMEATRPTPLIECALGAWIAYLATAGEVNDPQAAPIQEARRRLPDIAAFCAAVTETITPFAPLAPAAPAVHRIAQTAERILTRGPHAAIEEALA